MLWLKKLEVDCITLYRHIFPDSPPTPLTDAVAQFNSGLYWDCHETLENLWRATPYPLRHFYQAVIKIAVGFHHADRHNARGARNKLSEGLRLLKPFTPTFLGLDTDSLALEVQDWLNALGQNSRVDWVYLDKKIKPAFHSTS